MQSIIAAITGVFDAGKGVVNQIWSDEAHPHAELAPIQTTAAPAAVAAPVPAPAPTGGGLGSMLPILAVGGVALAAVVLLKR